MISALKNPALASEVRVFRRQRAAFFSDASKVLGKVQLRAILAMQVELNEGTALGRAFQTIDQRYRGGLSLSKSFEGYLTDSEIQALRGWDSAKSDAELADGFAIIAQLATAFGQIRKAAIATAVKAISSFGLALLLMYMLKSNVYPQMAQQFPVEKWMLPARFMYFAINAMFSNMWIFSIALAGLLILYIHSLASWSSPLRRTLDRSIFYSWYRSIQSLQVLLALALHLKAKRGVGTAIKLISEKSSNWAMWYLDEIRIKNQQGQSGGRVFDVGFFDKQITNRIILLSQAGSVETAMEEIAFIGQKELLEEFRLRILLIGDSAKNLALLVAVVPLALFFLTIGDFITTSAMSGFKK